MGTSRYLVLTAMIFAVAMMSIDQTIVSIAAPTIQRDLALTSTGLQWVINGYLLALAALFAFGGKLSDVVGHRRMHLGEVTANLVFGRPVRRQADGEPRHGRVGAVEDGEVLGERERDERRGARATRRRCAPDAGAVAGRR